MATRKTEWLASIKPILDKEEVKNDAKALAKELSDILEFKVTDADSLEQLTKEFNKQLVNMGKQQIVFSEKTLQGIVSQFANAIADGLSAGVNLGTGKLGQNIGDGIANGIVSGVKQGIADASSEIIAQINDLTKRKNELHEQSSKLDKRLKRYETLSEISTMEYDEFKPLKIDGDIDEQAQHIMGEFIDAEDALNEVTRGTKEYNAALIKALQASEKLYRMSRTINDNKDLVKDKTLLSDFEFSNLSDTTADVFEKADTDFNKILRNFYGYYEKQIKNIKVELGQIDEQMQALQQNKVEIIDQEKSKSALKTLKEIEEAYNRILKKEKSAEKVNEKISSAINYIPGSESLAVLKNRYDKSLSSNENWEVQYQWLVKFVKEYEDYAAKVDAETDGIKRRNMRAKLRRYDELYNQVSPIANIAEASLNQIIGNDAKPKGAGGNATSGPSQEDVDNANKIAEAGRQAREDAEAKAKAEKEAAEFAKQKRIEEEKTAKEAERKKAAEDAAEKERQAKEASMTNTLRKVVDFSGKQSKEYMSLIGADATTDVIGGEDYTVATDVLVEQLIDNVKKSILMSLHNHPDDMLAFTPSDIMSYGKLYKTQGVDIHGIIADGIIQTIDFTGISQEVILQIAQAFSKNLSEAADKSEGLFSFKDGDLKISDDVQALADSSPDAYNKIKDQLQFVINNALSKALTDNNLQPTIKTFNKENLQQLAEYLLQVGQNAGVAVNEAEKLNTLMSIKDKIVGGKKEETSAHQENTEAIKNETKVQEELNNVKSQTANIDDDSETIAKENGALEDKLELLRDIADQYAANITQKQRDRYEELNQKDMDTGLSDKEDERYYELGEQIDSADSALEEFGQTYDRIILKLENGKKVEILPDDKGLRSLYKFADEYGETYGGVEIEDVIFERVKQEANAHQENTVAIKNETKAQEELNNAKGKSQGTGDASSADVAAANTEAEKQRVEKERIEAEKIALQQEIANKNEELGRVRDELADEAYKHSEARSVLIAHIDEVEEERDKAFQSQVNAEREITEKDKVIKDLREQLAQVESGDGPAKSSIDVEELKNVLNAITYNVKVVQDSDGTDNKVAIDETSLEATLNKVFANVLNTQTRQSDGEQNQSPWALENTLQAVKGVLEQIKDNTTQDKQLDTKNLIRDPRGNIVTAYRGTHDSYVGLSSNRYNGASFFTDSLDLARMQYAGKNGKVEAANLSMANPLELDAHGGSWAAIEYIGDNADEASQKLHQLQSEIEQLKILIDSASDAKPGSMAAKIASLRRVDIEDLEKEKRKIFNDLNNPYGRYTTDQIAERLPEWGYDGAIIKNLVDGGTIPSTVMISLDPSQVHYIETLSGLMDDSNANELNAQQKRADGDGVKNNNNGSFALESTLQSVKGVLDNIQTNTAKIGTVNTSNVDTIAGTALDSRLSEIKNVLDSIDNKIAKGGVIATRGAVKQANADAQETPAKAQAVRSNMMKSIINDYETLGKLSAQFDSDGNLETKAKLENLKEEIKRKRASLTVTMEENAKLREQYSIAFDAQKRLLDAAKAQEDINQQGKDDEKAWKKRVKDAQRASGINAATSAANAGDQSVLRAIGTDGISADIEKQARELSNRIKELRALRDEIDKKGNQASEEDRDNLSKQISQVKTLKTELDGYLKIHEKYSGDNVTDLGDGSTFGAVGTDEYWNNITKAIQAQSTGRVVIKGLNADTGELTGTTKIAANTFAQWSATVDPITGRLSMLRTGIKKSETLIESITRKTKEIFTYFSGSSIIFKFFNELKRGVQYVKEIDSALVELRKVTDETQATYDKFLQTAAKIGDKLGSTISDVTRATATFAKLGYDISLASEMAEAALVYKNVGDGIESADEAASSIISTMKGFGLATSDSMRIVDSFNQVGNEFSVTSKGLGDALQRSAAALNAAGNTLDESIGLITAANTVINDPDSVGTAMKTLALRIRGAKTELAEAGLETENMAETTAKLQQKILALTHGNVDIMLDVNTFKSTTQIIRELSEAWKSMTDVERAAATELLAGQRQSNVLSALIQNFDIAEDAIKASAEASGSALRENEIWLDSIEGKLSQFTNSVQTMWSNALDSDIIKIIVDAGTGLIKLIDNVGLLQSALFALFTYLSTKKDSTFDLASILGIHDKTDGWILGKSGVSGWVAKKLFPNKQAEIAEVEKNITDITDAAANKMASNIKEMSDGQMAFDFDAINNVKAEPQEYKSLLSVLSQVKNTKLTMGDEQAVARQIDEINNAASQGQVALTQYASTLTDNDMALKAYIASLDGGQASIAGFNRFIQQHNIQVKESGIAAKAAAVGHALLNAAISMGISLIISAAISAITKLINKHKELAEAAKEVMTEYQNATKTLKDHHKTIQDIRKDYAELADGVDALGNNVSLTSEEYERYNEIANQIADMFPDMVTGYTEEGNAIINLKGDVEALTKAYEEEARAARDAILIGQNDVFKNFKNKTITEGFWSGQSKTDELEFFENLVNGKSFANDDVFQQWKKGYRATIDTWLENAGISDTNWLSSDAAFEKAIQDNLSQIQAYYRTLKATIDAEASSVRTVLNAYLEQDFDYLKLSDDAKNAVKSIVNQLDTEFYSQFNSATEMEAWITTNLIQPFQNSDMSERFSVAFDLQTQFNSGDVPVDVYLTQLSKFQELLRTLGVNEEIIKSISLLFDTDGLDAKQNVAKDFLLDEFDANVGQLTKTELEIVDKYADEFEKDMNGVGYTWDAFIAKINEKKLIDAFSPQDFEKVSDSLDSIQSAYNSLSDAVEQYNNTGYLTLDSLQSILSLEPEYLALLQMENGQLSINQAAAEAMIQTKLAEAEANAIQSAMTQLETLAKEAATKAINDNATAATNAITSLGNYSSALGTVAQDAIVAAGAVSALNNAVDGAKEAGVSEKDINAVMSNLDTYLSLINTTRQNLSTSFVPIVKGGTGKDPEKDTDVADDAFQKAMDYWENRINANRAKYEQVQNEIDLLEKKGQKASAEYYDEQIKLEGARLKLLRQQKSEARKYLGTLQEGSEEYWEVANTLNDIESEIDDVTASIIDLQDAIAEIDTYKFEEFNNRLDDITSKLGTIRDLIAPNGEEDWFDDNGDWTEAGVAVLGSYLQELETYKQGYINTAEELNKYTDSFDGNEDYYEALGIHSEQEYYDKTEELINQQYDFAESISDTEQSIVDMYESSIDAIEKYIDTLVDGYNDYIDSVKEALSAERALYDFKKSVQKQAKDISELERKIVSLSGSTNKSDIAQRRKLESELYKSRESLNDTYYDHVQEAQQNALDSEAQAYEKTMSKFVEGLRSSLETATANMDEFLMGVTSMVMYNADTVLAKYEEMNLPLTKELTNPWIEAKKAVGAYSGNALDLMNQWTREGGFFAQFNASGTTNLTSPWSAGTNAANTFKSSVAAVMSNVVSNIKSNVQTASGELSKLYQQIIDTQKRAASANVTVTQPTPTQTTPTTTTSTTPKTTTSTSPTIQSIYGLSDSQILALGYGPLSLSSFEQKLKNYDIGLVQLNGQIVGVRKALETERKNKSLFGALSGPLAVKKHAKGILSTTKDEWAIDSEPQFGDELVLVPTEQGNLSYMRKGTGIVPADLTQKLFELAQIPTSDLMNKNMTAIVPNITKNDFKNEFNFDSLVHVDAVDSNTLPQLEKMVDKKIDDFSRALNYSLKKFAR